MEQLINEISKYNVKVFSAISNYKINQENKFMSNYLKHFKNIYAAIFTIQLVQFKLFTNLIVLTLNRSFLCSNFVIFFKNFQKFELSFLVQPLILFYITFLFI